MNRNVRRPATSRPSIITTRTPAIQTKNIVMGLFVGLILLAAYAIKIAH